MKKINFWVNSPRLVRSAPELLAMIASIFDRSLLSCQFLACKLNRWASASGISQDLKGMCFAAINHKIIHRTSHKSQIEIKIEVGALKGA